MVQIDRTWLYERGGLHDARIQGVRISEGSLEIDLDDEWANERGLAKPHGTKTPTTLRFSGVASGKFSVGGGISEVLLQDDGTFFFVFANADAVSVHASVAECVMEP